MNTQGDASSRQEPLTPLSFLKAAIEAVPAVKYALGVGGIAAVVAIVAGFNIDYRIAVFGTIIVFGLMFLLALFARFSSLATPNLRIPLLFATWAFLILVLLTTTLLITSYFFSWPRSLEVVVSRVDAALSPTQPLPGRTVHLSDLPPANNTPMDRANSPAVLAALVHSAPAPHESPHFLVGKRLPIDSGTGLG